MQNFTTGNNRSMVFGAESGWNGGSLELKNGLKRGSWGQHVPVLPHPNVSAPRFFFSLLTEKHHFYAKKRVLKHESLLEIEAYFWRYSCAVSIEVLFFTKDSCRYLNIQKKWNWRNALWEDKIWVSSLVLKIPISSINFSIYNNQ